MLPLVGKETACEGAEGLEMGPLSWIIRWPSVQVSLYEGGRGELGFRPEGHVPEQEEAVREKMLHS